MGFAPQKGIVRRRLACLLLATALASAQSHQRSIHGTVIYRGGEPAADAAVELENASTQQVISQRTDAKGSYHFDGLNPDQEYSVSATKKGYWSKRHAVSKFSSKVIVTVDLT
ncbi:MAG TPA: carboxypeptidase-like regulatory domain-containing protein, partial [Bryobacteraceae bacterium]|nr:carboxypeptidase-like regulatory domain-containing protein [Bryobacteraceae bacterium]